MIFLDEQGRFPVLLANHGEMLSFPAFVRDYLLVA